MQLAGLLHRALPDPRSSPAVVFCFVFGLLFYGCLCKTSPVTSDLQYFLTSSSNSSSTVNSFCKLHVCKESKGAEAGETLLGRTGHPPLFSQVHQQGVGLEVGQTVLKHRILFCKKKKSSIQLHLKKRKEGCQVGKGQFFRASAGHRGPRLWQPPQTQAAQDGSPFCSTESSRKLGSRQAGCFLLISAT